MSRSRTASVTYVEEEVEVKPAIELIADEYEELGNVHVHVFVHGRQCGNVALLRDTLAKFGFVCKEDHVHDLQEIRLEDCEVFKKIRDNCDGLDGIIFFVFGYCWTEGYVTLNDGEKRLEDIWNMFNADQCPALKNKPKIFIFNIEQQLSKVARDGIRLDRNLVYDTPAEADILIVYRKAEGDADLFVKTLCDNINDFGDAEDAVSVLTYLAPDPEGIIAISTMTRRFYFVGRGSRGIGNAIEKVHVQIEEALATCASTRRSTTTTTSRNTTVDSSGGSPRYLRARGRSNGRRGSSVSDLRPPWRN